MAEKSEFTFGDDSIAQGYDNVLVPLIFDPWAADLLQEHENWAGQTVLDVAAGTGIVTKYLLNEVGPEGEVIALDANPQMLELAEKRCGTTPRYLEGTAQAMDLPDESVDLVTCQQGFQFFPDKVAAAKEIHRVLRSGGTALVSTWCRVEENDFFAAICESLESIGKPELSEAMRTPFDHMPGQELENSFLEAGFSTVHLKKQSRPLIIESGVQGALETSYGTPIAPQLRALPEQEHQAYREALLDRIQRLSTDGITMGKMVSQLMTAHK